MVIGVRSKSQWVLPAAAITAGVMIGSAGLFGLLPSAGFVLGMGALLLAVLFRRVYRWFVLLGVVLLACVFIEPSPSDIVIIAAIPLGLISGAYKPQALRGASVPAGLLLACFIASLPGIAASIDPAQSVRYCLITFYLFLFAVFVGTYSDRSRLIPLLRAYVLAAFVSFAAGLAGLLGLFPELLMADPYRVKGLFKDPNVFGPFFVPAIILLLDDMKTRRILKAPRGLHAAGIALLSAGALFSYSRAAWINLIAAALVYGALNVKAVRLDRLIRIALISGVLLAAAALLLSSPAAQGNPIVAFFEERAQLQEYDKDRFDTQQGGVELALQNPIGAGPGQFENVIAGVTGKTLSAHSLYIRTAAENGIAGFLLFFAALACLGWAAWFGPKATAGPQGCGVSPAALIAILAGILVNSLVVDTIHWRHFWFFIGIAMCCVRMAREKEEAHA